MNKGEKMKDRKIEKNNLFATFKTSKELADYFNQHIPEERRLLWMGAAFMNNLIAHILNEDDNQK